MDYLFYEYSFKKTTDSQNVKEIRPDIAVWKEAGWPELSKIYLRNPIVRMHPVVGLTLEQAQAFAKWRTKAVVIRLAYKNKYINEDEFESYNNMDLSVFAEDHPEYMANNLYFDYRIPTIEEWNLCFNYVESDLRNPKRKLGRFKKWSDKLSPYDFADTKKNEKDPLFYKKAPLNSVYSAHRKFKRFLKIYGLKGGVAEMVSDVPVAMGGSWKDNSEEFERVKMQEFTEPNAWTGFRCVGTWKYWKSKEQ
ncbi:SUMF1/EgtB/PvdO family nonheme iron enzyme [Jiulongibacter sediminis]|jgi:hypothetical protein|uniref:SUMF1/EgtB/PvdO family nonheme iron enzyme n=1 Tax=Jiulongibacter sediminis TaxID=1605367 RepID=UPI0026EECCA3|nr:SUMF1/EgtB/PvdO family nonheme iron enzyme [Jiulongibacter sediminis]